ncbi:MAG: glycoside hydrolase family 3 C-terminal domain-containing protein [Clostridia bacterium]|nr:glycoside hydrolase family 3 C-terminal domain-containing protein [Clostridia bacterium]
MMKKAIALLLALTLLCSVALSAGAEGEKKWTEKKMRPEGWIKVTQEGGKTLGYSPDSGVTIIEDDGFAFKDLNRNGELDAYEDWRLSNEERARDLSEKLEIEEMTPLFTHGGWRSFGAEITGDDLTYVEEGGRGGVTRSATKEGNLTAAVEWTNALQALCEATGNWGIPATISVDPSHVSHTIDQNSLASTFSVEEAFAQGVKQSKMYRAVGVTMLLGPQISVCSEPTMTRATGAFTEDPALSRDLTDAFISGLQSTWAEDGTDLGWGDDSVYAIAKHYVGDGAPEGGRNDHGDSGKYDVFPGYNFEAHLIPFFDAAFNLKGSITREAGVMPNYSISYSRDGSLGELVGGGYSEYKIGLLTENDYQGFILTDWQITNDGQQCYGVEDYSLAERFMLLYKNGIHQVGGTSDNEAAAEGYELLVDEIGDEEAEAILRNAVYHFFLSQFQSGLFDNPYIIEENAIAAVWNNQTDAEAKIDQQKTFILLKNSGNIIAQNNGEKKTVYIPMKFTPKQEGSSGGSAGSEGSEGGSAAKWESTMNIDAVSKYFNVVTDTVGEPTGEPDDEDGSPSYTENDIIRASAEEISACDFILVSMEAPSQDSSTDADGNWYPANLQYGEYTAVNARRESIAADVKTETINDGYYGTKTETVKINRSYANNTTGKNSKYSQLELLQYVNSVKGDAKVVVLMSKGAGPSVMVFGEVEPLADAILFYYGDTSWVFTDALMEVVNGDVEPNGLLPFQMPATMDAVEGTAQKEDVPRDVECYVDADGNVYDFAFGLNWSGVIDDERVATYKVDPLEKVENITFHYADE